MKPISVSSIMGGSKSTASCEESLTPSFDESVVLIETTKQDHRNDQSGIIDFLRIPPDAKFVVDQIEFPCHMELLSKRATILHDILLIHGAQEQVAKKQRTQVQRKDNDRSSSTLLRSSPSSIIMVAELKVDLKIFRAVLEFLYSNELSSDLYWDDKQYESPLVSDDDYIKSNEREENSQHIYRAMRFLQRLLVAADQFGIVPLKHEIEFKLYDEFLFSFTAPELYVWADSKSCAFLKEKAMDRICNKSSSIDDIVLAKDGWRMIRESNFLLEELFLYAREECHSIRYFKYDGSTLNHESREQNYYKVEYLRLRLSDLGLDIDGNREMLEERLRPHLAIEHRHFLPTTLTKLSSLENRENRNLTQKSSE
ncbi:unnamed protein product [Pseudo-nitzschia multistriata]|uniref:BTB domain-containing protein n=1 Tax=Pseudo-nitzschia multistriata TaxID=183589 RepID=A0A448ZDC8_9STRA|nr:unnamed protein product [Pseudo-nitzschia multistriata]